MSPAPHIPVCLFGASPTTRNLGVSALCHATLSQLLARAPEIAVTVFDTGRGARELDAQVDGRAQRVRCLGAHHSRRLWRSDSLWTMRLLGRMGGGGPSLSAVRGANAVLDLSGGDSFTDLYGPKRFWGVALPKLIALEQGVPLVLLPQTYGPFSVPRHRALAERIVRGASAAWARDARSHEALRAMAGAAADPDRLRLGVDVAFGLEPRAPERPLSETVEGWLAEPDRAPVVGLNPSGLVHGDPALRERLGFRADYPRVLEELAAGLLGEGARVVLVPHVLAPAGRPESDPDACEAVRAALGAQAEGRLTVLTPDYDQSTVKHLIARLDWFVGTRMHATIAALSSGVPAAAIAYSPKFQGVFETCAQGKHVHDPRALETGELVGRLLESYRGRAAARETLGKALPAVRRTLDAQFDAVVALCRAGSAAAAGGGRA